MPYPKRTYAKKRYQKKKSNTSNYQMKSYKPKMVKTIPGQYKFVRSAYDSLIQTNAATAAAFGWSFYLSAVPNYSEFTNLYDEYRIDYIKMIFTKVGLQTNTGTTIITPNVYYCIDKDDSSPPSNVDQLMQYQSVKIKSVTDNFTISFAPRFQTPVYISGTSTGYRSSTGFLDCTHADVPHHGIKLIMDPSGTASAWGYTVYVKYYMTFKGVR